MYRKCVIKKGNSNLSGFYPNAIPGVFAFRKRDWYMFGTKKQAKKFLKGVKKEVYNKSNQNRWGEKYTKKHLSNAKKLKIYCEK